MRGWIVVMLFVPALAGCSGDVPDGAPIDEPPACTGSFCGQGALDDGTGRDLRTGLVRSDTLQAPQWKVGDVFEQHMFFGRDDKVGRHIQTMVVQTDADGYTVATSDEVAAWWEAVYDYPVLGRIGKGLQTTAFGSDWSWMYQFPLKDGATWNGRVEQLINWNSFSFSDLDLQMSASYEAAIDTPQGAFPGFWIEAKTDGELLARYNYVPAVGWFSHLWMYDIETSDPDDIMFYAQSMGTWTNYTGSYYTASSQTLLEHFSGVFPDPTGPVQGDPLPQTFTVPADQSRLMGVVVPVAVGGRTDVRLTDPDGQSHPFSYSQFSMEGPGFDVFFLDLEPIRGDWQAQTTGLGVATGAFVWVAAVASQTGQM